MVVSKLVWGGDGEEDDDNEKRRGWEEGWKEGASDAMEVEAQVVMKEVVQT